MHIQPQIYAFDLTAKTTARLAGLPGAHAWDTRSLDFTTCKSLVSLESLKGMCAALPSDSLAMTVPKVRRLLLM